MQVHRIALNNQTCTVLYESDGSMEPCVSPARMHHPSREPAIGVTLESVKEETVKEETVKEAPAAPQIKEEAEVPKERKYLHAVPRFKTKSAVKAFNTSFRGLMKARLKRFKHKCRWCCHLRFCSL